MGLKHDGRVIRALVRLDPLEGKDSKGCPVGGPGLHHLLGHEGLKRFCVANLIEADGKEIEVQIQGTTVTPHPRVKVKRRRHEPDRQGRRREATDQVGPDPLDEFLGTMGAVEFEEQERADLVGAFWGLDGEPSIILGIESSQNWAFFQLGRSIRIQRHAQRLERASAAWRNHLA